MRELIPFRCGGDTLIGTLDRAQGTRGLLIVSAGNEPRIGAHRGMALMAARLAERGHPVFRFDRRGIGDSTGPNRGFEESGPDIAAAIAAFGHAMPSLTHATGFGMGDAASALALHDTTGIDALVLANPWIVDPAEPATPTAEDSPLAWGKRLLTRRLNIARREGGSDTPPDRLAGRVAAGLAGKGVPVTILTAQRDNTAIAFTQALATPAYAELTDSAQFATLDSDSPNFHRADEQAWLDGQLLAALAG